MNPLRPVGFALSCSMALALFQTSASAGPSLVVDVANGKVLEQEDATRPWYPASLTKLLTVYIALSALRDGRVSLDTPFVVSARAASMPPSKMGFKPGTEVTLDNALKMMMVKSANDLAVVLAEGLDGSVENFAIEMNSTAAKLGLQDSHFANPNGLQNPDHHSSARDLAIVARDLFRDFPQYDGLYDIGAVQLGDLVIPTHNNILGRYPGVDGMKTGYTCSSGFNLVASVKRGDRHLIVVVLGSPNVKARTLKAGALLDAAFENRFPEGPELEALPASSYTKAPDMHQFVCGKHRSRVAMDEMPPLPPPADGVVGLPAEADQIYAVAAPHFQPIPVFVGPKPGWSGPVAAATDSPTPLAPVSAYAPEKQSAGPLAPDPKAIPLTETHREAARGVRLRAKAVRRARRAAMRSQARLKQEAKSRNAKTGKAAAAKTGKAVPAKTTAAKAVAAKTPAEQGDAPAAH